MADFTFTRPYTKVQLPSEVRSPLDLDAWRVSEINFVGRFLTWILKSVVRRRILVRICPLLSWDQEVV